VKLAIDRGPNHLRRIINEMLAEEQPPADESAPLQAAG
jgi:hypothetical protein